MRNTFIDHLTRKAAHDPSIFLVVGDLGFTVVEPFMEKFPDRFLNAGVAEQNMTSLAAGIAREGFRVFTYSIANFTTMRCLEQIRNDVCYHRLSVCVVSVGGGFMYGNLGPTHHATEDIAVMRVMPYTRVFVPFSRTSTRMAVDEILSQPGPAYLRLGREDQPVDRVADNGFTLVHAAREGARAESCIISVGQLARGTVDQALADQSDLYALCRIKPLPEGAADLLARYRRVRVIEDHQHHGGAFSALSEAISRLESCSIRDRFSSKVAKEVEQRQAMISGPGPDKGM